MIRKAILYTCLFVFLSGCNLYGGLSNPSNDQQYLDAARACFDHGNYDCALSNYNALSAAFNDTKISEISLTNLAKNGLFSMDDLIKSLGDGNGNGASVTAMTDLLFSRGKTQSSDRVYIQQIYSSDNSIFDAHQQGYAHFIADVAMINALLAAAVTSGSLKVTDIVTNAACLTDAACGGGSGDCAAPAGTNFLYPAGADTTVITSSTGWSGPASIKKLVAVAQQASTDFTAATDQSSTNFQGIVSSLHNIVTAGGLAGEICVRQGLAQVLFP